MIFLVHPEQKVRVTRHNMKLGYDLSLSRLSHSVQRFASNYPIYAQWEKDSLTQ